MEGELMQLMRKVVVKRGATEEEIGEEKVTWQRKNEEIRKMMGIGTVESEMRIRRLRWMRIIIEETGDNIQLGAVVFGDMEAVEEAIQTVLAACKEFDVACGITAGVDDIGERLAQGFKLIIVNQPEALSVGLEESGRGG